jgi:hypothetical protein
MSDDTIDIPPGSYRLTRDVANPWPDRRYNRDWRKLPVWEKGARFTVRELRRMGDRHLNEMAGDLEPTLLANLRARDRYTVVELAGDRYPSLHRVGPGDREQYAALGAAFEPSDESLAQFMTRIGCDNTFAEWLLEKGIVTRLDFEQWWHRYEYGDDDGDPIEAPAIVTLPVTDDDKAPGKLGAERMAILKDWAKGSLKSIEEFEADRAAEREEED